MKSLHGSSPGSHWVENWHVGAESQARRLRARPQAASGVEERGGLEEASVSVQEPRTAESFPPRSPLAPARVQQATDESEPGGAQTCRGRRGGAARAGAGDATESNERERDGASEERAWRRRRGRTLVANGSAGNGGQEVPPPPPPTAREGRAASTVAVARSSASLVLALSTQAIVPADGAIARRELV